ncbi:MAG TPA: hypothetical protein VNJ01_13330 [Bacteriovoracaceae bacterium]|nr:hypothetical protein [Bacteriovoracaceae bacterium]
MKLTALALLLSTLSIQNSFAQAFEKVSVNCTIIKDGDVSPMDEGISTMEDYNKIGLEFETDFNSAGGLGSLQTTLKFKKGFLGGFPLNPKTDRVTLSKRGNVTSVSITKRDWKNVLFVVNVENTKGALLYLTLPSTKVENAGTLRCKITHKPLI